MGVASFSKGSFVLIDERPHILRQRFDANTWQVEEEKTGRIKEFTQDQLHLMYKKGVLVFTSDSNSSPLASDHVKGLKQAAAFSLSTSDEEWKKAIVIRQYVLAILDIPTSKSAIEPAIQNVWLKLGAVGTAPHWVTVTRWKKKYLSAGMDVNAVVVKNHAKGNRNRRYPIEILSFVDESVEKIYLTRERNTYQDTLDHAIVSVQRENKLRPKEMQLALPTYRLVKAAIGKLTKFDVYAARYGRIAATRMFRGVLKQHAFDHALESAEIDHTKLDLFVVDDSGMPWGRPWVTICIDTYTRCILGIYVGFEPPSYLTVARCLKHALLPKVDLHESFPEIKNTWDAHGVMEVLVVDNGLEFHSDSLDAACFSIGIDIQYTPRKTPWWKGTVERFIGTMNRGVAHGIPGTTFSNIFDKDDYDPEKNAVITFNNLKLILNKWIVDVYHQRPHKSLDNITPAAMWASSLKTEDINVPDDPAKLDAILGRTAKRILSHKGIELEGLFYNSPDLIALRRRLGDRFTVEVRVDDGDLGAIFVIAPDKTEYFKVPCINQNYADGLSLWLHKICKHFATNHHKDSNDIHAWMWAKEEIAEIVQQATLNKPNKSKKNTSKSKVARYTLANQPNNKAVDTESLSTPPTTTMSEAPPKDTSAGETRPSPTRSSDPVPRTRPTFEPIIEDRSEANLQQNTNTLIGTTK